MSIHAAKAALACNAILAKLSSTDHDKALALLVSAKTADNVESKPSAPSVATKAKNATKGPRRRTTGKRVRPRDPNSKVGRIREWVSRFVRGLNFTPQLVATALDMSQNTANQNLVRMAKAGEVVKVAPGLYRAA